MTQDFLDKFLGKFLDKIPINGYIPARSCGKNKCRSLLPVSFYLVVYARNIYVYSAKLFDLLAQLYVRGYKSELYVCLQ